MTTRNPKEPSYELSLEQGNGWIKAISRARSNNFPGLSFSKEVIVSASPLMTLRYRLLNKGTQAHTVQLNPRIWLGDREKARLTLPRAERLVHERAALFSSTHGDVPEKPKGMAERWLAWRVDDFVMGLIWDDSVEKHEWSWAWVRFDRPSLTLEPGTATEMPPMYFYAGPGDWADVRRAWGRVSGRSLRQMRIQPQLGRKLEFGFDPSPIISLRDQVKVTLRADSVREQTLEGRIEVEPPAGWRAEPTEFAWDELKHERPLTATVRLEAEGNRVGAFAGQLHLESNRFDTSEPFTLIRLGDETVPVQVNELAESDQPLFLIDNGLSRWQVAPAYHAGVVGWSAGASDVNHLRAAFPQEGGTAMSWLKPWFGGIQPILTSPGVEDEGWPGKLHEEQFSAQACRRTDERGISWHGVCLGAQLEREEFQGLRAEVEYLTVGRSNLLKVVYRLVNETGIYRRANLGLLIFCQVDGRYDNSTLHSEGVQRKRTPVMAWPEVERWGAVTNPESGRTLALINGTPRAWLELSDWGQDGGHLLCHTAAVVPPRGHKELIVYLALADSLEEACRYAVLAGQASELRRTSLTTF